MNKTIRHFGWGLLLAGSCFFLSCVGDGEGVDKFGIVKTDGKQSAYAAVQTIFNNNNCNGCHNASHFSGLDLQSGASYGSLVNVDTYGEPTIAPTKRVLPGFPDSSFLYHKITLTKPELKGGNGGDPMPPPNGGLSQTDIDIIEAWITCGAPDLTDDSVCPGVND